MATASAGFVGRAPNNNVSKKDIWKDFQSERAVRDPPVELLQQEKENLKKE
eukprot:SAG22_NODE_98_length_20720_cov_17.226662_20_plen_51_part_00